MELPDAVSDETVALATGYGDSGPFSVNQIDDALQEIATGSRRAAAWHSKRGALYGRLYLALGLPAAILAAAAAVTGFASTAGRIPAAIIALASAAVSAASTFLNCGAQRRYHQEMASQWYTIASEARLHSMVDLHKPAWRSQDAVEVLKGLIARQAQLIQGKPVVLSDQGMQVPKAN
ncbi:MAG TPA: hypothetical protein VI357_05815 [Mycobacteriales bacterium]